MKKPDKIVVAADSFKGCLTSAEVAEAVRRGILDADSECNVICIPVGDGGEGTAEALTAALKGDEQTCLVSGPLGTPTEASYGIVKDNCAVIEMASAAGLTLIPKNKRNPLKTSTFGVGQLVADAIKRNCRHIMLCIGGSATNDAGLGMLQALGYRFLDREGRLLTPAGGGAQLRDVAAIDASHCMPLLDDVAFTVACDVQNPFYGPTGAVRVFAHQKGANDAMIVALDEGMQNFAHVVSAATGIDLQSIPGAGAAGGLGGALHAFLGASLRPGIEMMLDAIDFDQTIHGAKLVITGEGKLDSQTIMGKTPYGVMRRAKRHGIPVVAIGGSVNSVDVLNEAGFDCVLPILPEPVSLAKAMQKQFAENNIARTVSQLLRMMILPKNVKNLSQI